MTVVLFTFFSFLFISVLLLFESRFSSKIAYRL
nr:MAG TPA: hypothetical protein [Caudoviricetes sp.]DAW46958.1 MAG TPA: hypothetical protein [Caudoviricetes sp.]DAY34047.1 MAG TPA: hypothetical protein [Caudoviricetes sp.]